MSQIKNISIPKPCHESWQQMTAVDQGRHCARCCKTVTDFTMMTDAQVITHLASRNNICGRFDNLQLTQLNQRLQSSPQSISLWKKIVFAAAVLLAVPFVKVNAQIKYKTERIPGESKHRRYDILKAREYTAANINIKPPLQAVNVNPISTEERVRFEVLGGVSVQGITIHRVLCRAWDKTKWAFGGN